MQEITSAIEENNIPLILNYLDRGLNPNLQDRIGFTILNVAVVLNRIEIILILLDAGANRRLSHLAPGAR